MMRVGAWAEAAWRVSVRGCDTPFETERRECLGIAGKRLLNRENLGGLREHLPEALMDDASKPVK